MKFVQRHTPDRALLRIIPHKSVLNSRNRKLTATLYELLNVEQRKYPWQHREGLHIALRPAPDLWWCVRMSADRIEFYVGMPTEFVDAFRTKFRNHEQWKRCTIESVDPSDYMFPPDDDTDLYTLRYKRHDMFSLDFDYTQQSSPVRDLMNVSNDLSEGETVDLFYRLEAEPRDRWKKIADYAWESWQKGGMPYRAGLDPARLVRDLFGLMWHVVFEAGDLARDVMLAIRNSFFHGKEEKEQRERPKAINRERTELLVNGDLSSRTKKKHNQPAFKTSIRYTVHSSDTVRRGMIAKSVAVAFDDLCGDNRLVPVKVNLRAKKELGDLRNWRIHDLDPNRMSVDEVGKLIQLPTADVQEEFADSLESNQRVEVDIPAVFLDPSGLYVGSTEVRGQSYPIHIPANHPDTLMTARAFMGSPRQGKDQAIINLIVESKRKHGIGAVIPDWIDERAQSGGHQRGMADAIRDSLPPEDVIDIDWGDFDWPVYFGLGGITKNARNSRIASDRIAKELTNFLMGEDIDHHTTREYLRDAAKVCGGDLLEIRRLFVDGEYRLRKIGEMEATNIGDADMWRSFDEDMSDAQRAQIFAPVNVRMGEILNDEVLKPIFCQQMNEAVDMERWIREGKVVILRIPTREMSEMSAKITAYFVIMTTFLTKLSMNGAGAMTWLVLNEPHQVQTPGLVHFIKRILAEGPKYRLAPIFAFHHLGQLSKDFADTLVSSALSWHLFYNSNAKMYDALRVHIEPTFTPESAMKQTERFHYIAAGWRDPSGATQVPFMVKAPDLVKNRWGAKDNSNLTRECSRTYGRPIDEVLADFKRRMRTRKLPEEVADRAPQTTAADQAPKPKKQPPPHVFKKKSHR